MKKESALWPTLLIGGLLLLIFFAGTAWLGKPIIGSFDFRAYWSAAYLLAHSQNFADPALMLQVEQAFTYHHQTWPVMTWNLPWMVVLFIPYIWFGFDQAVWLWILTNITMVLVGTIWFWQTIGLSERKPGLSLLVAFVFAPTFFVFVAGQVGGLVFLGLAGFLYFYNREQDKMAGGVLVLTLIKPHIVYLVIPLVLLAVWRRRRRGVWLGFGGLILILLLITFALRPQFVADYWQTMAQEQSRLLAWQNATLGGIALAFGWGRSLKWIGLVLLPLSILMWWRWGQAWPLTSIVLWALPVAVLTAPFGWAYDQIVLLPVLLQIVGWFVLKRVNTGLVILLGLILVAANGFAYYLRYITVSDAYYIYYTAVLAFVFYLVAIKIEWPPVKVRNGT